VQLYTIQNSEYPLSTHVLELNKSNIHQKALELVQTKLLELEAHYEDLKEGQSSNSKSTAGDKHDTEREKVQQEIDNVQKQLSRQKNFRNILSQISPDKTYEKARLGAFVQTESGRFYISIPFGKINVSGEAIWCISAASPIGQALLNKEEGHSFSFNGKESRILSIH